MKGVLAVETYLENLVPARQDDTWIAVRNACRDARSGKGSVEDARQAFIAYSRRRDILIEDEVPVAGSAAGKLHAA